MSNEQIIAERVREIGGNWVSVAWFLWALRLIENANKKGVSINPEYLRAKGRFIGPGYYDDEPRPITADE